MTSDILVAVTYTYSNVKAPQELIVLIYILYPAAFEYHRGRNWFDKTVHKVLAKLDHPEPDRNKVVLSNL